MALKKGLGRGLDALIPSGSSTPRQMRQARQESRSNPAQTEESKKEEVKKEEASSNTADSEKRDEKKTEEKKETSRTEKTVRRRGLGSGVPTVSGTVSRKEEPEQKKGPEMIVPVIKVEPNREQPRKKFNEDALLELSESVKQYGVLQPLLVSDKGDYYEIIAGERRWRAAKLAGLKEIPVIVKEFTPLEILEISLIENIQREDLNPIEEATAYRRLIDEFHMKQDEVAEKVSKSRTAVTNSMRLLKLEKDVQQMLIDEMISAGHARALLAITNPEAQIALANRIFEEKLSVREIERLVKLVVEPKPAKPDTEDYNPAEKAAYEKIEERMKEILGTRVSIHRKKNNKGKIEIEYYSGDELERIVDLLSSIR